MKIYYLVFTSLSKIPNYYQKYGFFFLEEKEIN